MQRPVEPVTVPPLPSEVETVRALATKPASPCVPADAVWNAISRAWFVTVDGEAVRLDPQPAPPGVTVRGFPVSPRVDVIR